MQACEEGEVVVRGMRHIRKDETSCQPFHTQRRHSVCWESGLWPAKDHVLRPGKQELLKPAPAHQVLNLTLRVSNAYLRFLHPVSLTHRTLAATP